MQVEPQVWKLQEKIKEYLHLENRYVLAVSGGADSMALLDAARVVFSGTLGNLMVCHVEHGIRGQEALADAELVQDFCESLGINYICCHVNVPEIAKKENLSLEAAARKVRYEILFAQARKFGALAVVTAHQADDQAETVLWKLLRGAGSDGMSGMQHQYQQEDMIILRPLLDFSRNDIETYCRLREISYCEDSTNSDLGYTRNRIRCELLPYLERNYNPAIKATLIREAKLLAEEQECLAKLVDNYLEDKAVCGRLDSTDFKGMAFWLDAKSLLRQPAALRKRILRSAFFRLGGKELSYERSLALEGLCVAQTGGKIIQLPGETFAIYKNKRIIFYRGGK